MTYLSSRQVAEKVGVQPATIRSWRRRGKFPEPDLLPTPQAPLWAVTTVDAWMAAGGPRDGRIVRRRKGEQ